MVGYSECDEVRYEHEVMKRELDRHLWHMLVLGIGVRVPNGRMAVIWLLYVYHWFNWTEPCCILIELEGFRYFSQETTYYDLDLSIHVQAEYDVCNDVLRHSTPRRKAVSLSCSSRIMIDLSSVELHSAIPLPPPRLLLSEISIALPHHGYKRGCEAAAADQVSTRIQSQSRHDQGQH